MSEENNNPSTVTDENEEVKTVIDNTNFSNELNQLQDSLFKDEIPQNQQDGESNAEKSNSSLNESDDKQIIKISPETDEEQPNQTQNKQLNEDPERKIEVFNNIAGLNQPIPQTRRPEKIPIRQRIANWYSSLEKRVGEAEAKESLVVFIRNASAFVVGSFFVSTIAEFIDNLK